MKNWTRCDLLKTGLFAPAVAATAHEAVAHGRIGAAIEQAAASPFPPAGDPEVASPGAGRERLLLDFGWRFHFGNANDPTRDFGLGEGRSGNFQKTGKFLSISSLGFDDSDWQSLNLPHDWAVELPFTNDPALTSKGFTLWGATIRTQASDGIAASSDYLPPTPAGGSPLSLTAHTARPWWP